MNRRILLTVFVAASTSCSTSQACSVPVFRYALENWQADPYVVTVFHRGPLTGEEQELLSILRPVNEDGYPAANVFVRTVDLSEQLGEATQSVWDQHQTDALPHVVVQVPGKFGAPASDVWSGPLDRENMTALIASPVRETVEKRLLEGTSVVWLFLESGDEDRDDAAFDLLTEELDRLEASLQLPEIDPADFAELSVAPEALKLEFNVLRVSRDDPAERMLVEMLLSVESDLRDEQFVNQPMAFPVFGRGRALYALLGNGIQPATIEDASRFLVGACQCTVKAQNPGVDLLMPVDWDRYVEPAFAMETSLPPLSGLGGFVSDEGHEPADAASPADETPEEDSDIAPAAPLEDSGTDDNPSVAPAGPDELSRPEDPQETSTGLDAERPRPDSQGDGMLRNTMVVISLAIAGVVMASVLLMRRP